VHHVAEIPFLPRIPIFPVREVCALLFFRCGITPTINKLYQFVRKDSMSVPTEVLSDFWKELREKGKVQIMQPDLPEDLCNMAGEVMSTI
jgi:hypothetical protein